jgi:hypothetical protein
MSDKQVSFSYVIKTLDVSVDGNIFAYNHAQH